MMSASPQSKKSLLHSRQRSRSRSISPSPSSPSDLNYTTASSNELAQVPIPAPASWLTLPHKRQLFVLALCRLSEPLTNTSLLSYLYFLIESFHSPGTAPPSAATIARRAGILASSFALSQCLTGMVWGRLSDHIGRKPCVLLGLLGSALSILGFGFSETFESALMFRVLAGCLNGNVGVLRTMLSETIREKRHQSRAFLIMPMCFNVGIILGPALGGVLADPASSWPEVFGNWEWCHRHRWALPNVVSAMFLMGSFIAGLMFLDETLESKKHRSLSRDVQSFLSRQFHRLRGDQTDETSPLIAKPATPPPPSPPRKILTPNIIKTLFSFMLLPLHNSTFMNLYPLLLSAPHGTPLHGGLSLSAQSVGLALSILGAVGIAFQLLLYPPLQAHFGLLRSFQLGCCLFPVAYMLTPFLSFLSPGSTVMWAGIMGILGMQVAARTFALPGSVILLTNSVEEEGVLGTVHGIGSSLASAGRAVGPVMGAWLFAVGLEGSGGMGIGGVFWGLATVAATGAVWGLRLKEGRGLGV
ncbi:major facilitator superfamily domain-containing protein [Tricharina praecox]|uniref:major facilitator superfamily domain-containing protein n=1 Tax=Tricharina praecox TaxID=43433 RepID=UPI00221FEFC4|nr:major facilitator superfamily domain-containing protein [Tricharina praecox]KAI5859220.1 major facilitator superfamily domain-containing protein [Tricharina praecox]